VFDLPSVSIPVSVFLYVYGAYMVFFLLYSLFNVYHLVRYGVYGFGLYTIVTIFTGGTILLAAGSVFLLMGYDWSAPLSLETILPPASGDGLFPTL